MQSVKATQTTSINIHEKPTVSSTAVKSVSGRDLKQWLPQSSGSPKQIKSMLLHSEYSTFNP